MGLYIIGNVQQNICKIGVSKNPSKRLKQIQTGCPFKVSILAYVEHLGRDSEKEMHKRYKGDRMQGEWFRINDEIRSIIGEKSKPKKPKKRVIKEIPPISFMEERRLAKKPKRYKRNSKHIKNVYNHK